MLIKNVKIIVTSINPIIDSKAKKYSVTNNHVISFNVTLKSKLNSNVQYCDTYSQIDGKINTSDGVHYDTATNKLVYEAIQKCINGG